MLKEVCWKARYLLMLLKGFWRQEIRLVVLKTCSRQPLEIYDIIRSTSVQHVRLKSNVIYQGPCIKLNT